LQEVDIHPIDRGNCEKILQLGRILPTQVCSMNLNPEKNHNLKDACTGDSGGPYVCQVPQSQVNRIAARDKDSYLGTMKSQKKDEKMGSDLFVQYGLTSWGIKCGTGKPGVYTKISAFKDWILRNLAWDSLENPDKPYNEKTNKPKRSYSAQIWPCRAINFPLKKLINPPQK